jgi:menaquinone-dependent protoporphyrinogen oxidase
MEDAVRAAARIAAHPPRSVWLFSSGPIGDPPGPDENPVDMRAIVTSTGARGHRLFAGRRAQVVISVNGAAARVSIMPRACWCVAG